MQQCPKCKKETKEMLVQKPGSDDDSLDLVCLRCGAVKPTDNVESIFKEKGEVRSTNKEGEWDSDVHTAPKSIADYGNRTEIGTKDAKGNPIKPTGEQHANWGELRKIAARSDTSNLEHLKRDHNELFKELIRRIIPVQQIELQEKTLFPLYLKCLELGVNRGRDTELIMIGIICIYLNQENIPWKGDTTIWEHISDKTGRKKKEIQSIISVIMRRLDWEIDGKGNTYAFHQKSYNEIDRIIKKIKEGDNSFRELKISKRAYEIIEKVSRENLTDGISPKNQAGAAIFLACNSEDLPVSLDDIAVYCDTKKKNIMPHIKKFNSVLKYDINF